MQHCPAPSRMPTDRIAPVDVTESGEAPGLAERPFTADEVRRCSMFRLTQSTVAQEGNGLRVIRCKKAITEGARGTVVGRARGNAAVVREVR